MVERITGQGLSSGILADNQRTLARLATYQLELSSTKRINVVSDDPVGARQAMRYRAQTLETGKYIDNVNKSTAFMDASDSAMGQMSQVMDSIKALAVQGANGSQDAAGRQALAQSATSLLGQLVDLGNTVHDGRYIFAGTATGTPPFALSSDGGLGHLLRQPRQLLGPGRPEHHGAGQPERLLAVHGHDQRLLVGDPAPRRPHRQ